MIQQNRKKTFWFFALSRRMLSSDFGQLEWWELLSLKLLNESFQIDKTGSIFLVYGINDQPVNITHDRRISLHCQE